MRINYIIGTPFRLNKNCAIVNTLSADWVFKKNNINIEFIKLYNSKEYLLAMHKDKQNKIGVALNQKSNNKNIYHLIIKNTYWEKSDIKYLEKSLISLKNEIIKDNVREICFTRQNNYLEDFDWIKVELLFKKIFDDLDINILICSY